LNEADGTLHRAIALCPSGLHLFLTLTRLRIGQGRYKDTGQIISFAKPLLGASSSTVRDEFAKLEQQVARQP